MGKEVIEVIEVPTETENKIQLPNGEVVNQIEYLVWLGNKILNIEKVVG